MSAPVAQPQLTRLPALDGVRAVAATAVMVHHVAFFTGRSLRGTWEGYLAVLDSAVAVFFVLSGFLLFRPYVQARAEDRPRPSTGRYLWKRALRILPAYWLTVAACLIVLPETGRVAPTGDWVRHLTLTQIYEPGQIRRGLGHTWTLAVEVAFYLILPFIAALLLGRVWRPRRVAATAGIAAAITAGWVLLYGAGWLEPVHTMWLPGYAVWFGVGMTLAGVHVAVRGGTAPRGWRVVDQLATAPWACWSIAAALLFVASTPVAGPRGLTALTAGEFGAQVGLYAAVGGLVVLPVAFGPHTRASALLASRPMRWLGTISFGIFLWHPLVLELIYQVSGQPYFTGDPYLVFGLTFAGTLVLATVSYYALERPIMRLGPVRPRLRRRARADSHSPVTAASTAS